jgi:aromatic-L-amino-acid/L-tryptophan decarboxylase
VAIVAARSLYKKNHPDTKLEDMVIYTSTQTHSLGSKAGLVLGIKVRAIEVYPDDRFALRGEALRDALVEDAKIGLKPFILSNVFFYLGGSFHVTYFYIDQLQPLEPPLPVQSTTFLRYRKFVRTFTEIHIYSIFLIHSLVKSYPWLWVHVDAAWAGSALSCPEYRDELYLKEINAFTHSFCSNFHKVCDVVTSISATVE